MDNQTENKVGGMEFGIDRSSIKPQNPKSETQDKKRCTDKTEDKLRTVLENFKEIDCQVCKYRDKKSGGCNSNDQFGMSLCSADINQILSSIQPLIDEAFNNGKKECAKTHFG